MTDATSVMQQFFDTQISKTIILRGRAETQTKLASIGRHFSLADTQTADFPAFHHLAHTLLNNSQMRHRKINKRHRRANLQFGGNSNDIVDGREQFITKRYWCDHPRDTRCKK
jgi:hypothetical protein